jgi:glutathione S-transferase
LIDLYHNAASACSQKVRLVLEEKGIEWKSHEVDLLSGAQHDPDYIKLNPNHVVPTIIHDGHALIESTLINEYLEDAFSGPTMRSRDPLMRHAAGLWMKRIDHTVHPAAGIITYAIGPRAIIMSQPEEVRERNIAAISDPERRAARRSVLEHGVKAPEFAGALGHFLDLIDAMESALSPGEWLSGESFGLADAGVLPYVLRLDQLAMSSLLEAKARPSVADWFGRIRARPSFRQAVTEWLPEPILNLFRSNGEAVWADVEPLTNR